MKRKRYNILAFGLLVTMITLINNMYIFRVKANGFEDREDVDGYAVTLVDSGKCGDNAVWTLTSDYVLTISGSGEFVTPKKDTLWDKYSQDIKKVIIGDKITNIPNAAFGGYGREYKKLDSVNISESVKSIGFAAFENSSLKSLEIPSGVKTIDAYAFRSCSELKSIKISNTVSTIGSYAFADTAIESIVIPDSVNEIGNGVFYYCKQLKKVIIGKGITVISCGVFESDVLLAQIEIPSTVQEIGSNAFLNCENLSNMRLSEGIKKINSYALYGTGIDHIVIPKSVETIDDYMCYQNVKLLVYEDSAGLTYAKQNNMNYEIIESGLKIAPDGKWYYYVGDEVDTSYTGMAYANNRWWYVENGTINFKYTGMAYGNGRWWYMKDGAIDFKYTGMAYGNGRWWYFNNGAIDFKYTGTAYYKQWWYFSNGALNFKYTGMGYANNNWWMFQNGAINFKYTGIGQNKSGKWYFRNGQIAWKYSGNVTYGGKTYKVQNGKVVG